MSTWLTSGVGIASAAGATIVTSVVVVYTTVGERFFPPPHSVPQAQVAEPKVAAPSDPEIAALPPQDLDQTPSPSEVAAAPVAGAPSFDLIRVEADRSAVIAGNAAPGQKIRILMGTDQIETVTADAQGNFVALTQLPDSTEPQAVRLEQISANGTPLQSSETVLVMPSNADRTSAPKVVVASVAGVNVVQPGAQEPINLAARVDTDPNQSAGQQIAPSQNTAPETVSDINTKPALSPGASVQALSLDAISYDAEGEVLIEGRGRGEQFVRVYLDNEPVETEVVPGDGNWQVRLPEVEAGIYTLRVDELDAAGAVTSRVESPFKRETPQAVAQAALDSPLRASVTVQPGHTLWALADESFGDGLRYIQIFEANRDQIKNPDLIYPGQVFELPN